MKKDFATIAGMTKTLTPEDAREWARTHDVSVNEMFRIVKATKGDMKNAQRHWADGRWWADDED